jgi:hypothetical protein
MKQNKPAAALPPSSPRAKRGPRAAALFPILLLAASILSCLKPIGFGPEDLDPVPADPTPIVITGIAPVTGETAKIFNSATAYTEDIHWSPPIPTSDPYKDQFEPFKDYTATIELAMKGDHTRPPAGTKVTVDGALSAEYDAANGRITAKFPRTHYPVKSVDELKSAIGELSPLPAPAGSNNENIIELTQAFYTSVASATEYIPIGIGAATTIPYTVRGLGNEDSDPALRVGVLLANDNITLENVRIAIDTSTKGVPRQWTISPPSSYRAAVLVGRYDTDPGSGVSFTAGTGSNNVTVKNCNISFGGASATGMIGGIFLSGNEQNISIANNTVSVEAPKGSAAQALLVLLYNPGVSITGNGFKSHNIAATHGNPASAIFMQVRPDMASSVTPLISDNRVNGSPTYDFYINILSDGTGNRTGVPALVAGNNFATPQSTWMTAASTDTGSFYKKLLTTLLSQSRIGVGYGYLAMYFGSNDCVFECYAQEDGKVKFIDFWGYKIAEGKYIAGSGAPSYTDNVRARLRLSSNGSVILDSDNKPDLAQFQWWVDGSTAPNLPSS